MMDFNKLDTKVLGGMPELHHVHHRSLGSNSNDNSFESLLVDGRGNEYDPYSLAWRYLGLYKDCADEDDQDDDNYDDYGSSHHSGSGDESEDCQRKLLWAAYVDPRYSGNAIEEYQYYDLSARSWDDSACTASGSRHRCARMDCHEPFTHFKLVGIFKETDGMYDFTEQLFKHEGYCVWQGGDNNNNDNEGSGSRDSDDTYETMETWMENWPTGCNKLDEADQYGNNLYMAMEPQPEGNMTLAIYTDNKCMTVHEYIDYESYIVQHYVNLYEAYSYWYGYDYGYNLGLEAAEAYKEGIEVWNEKMSTFKICQPCRAYNLFAENDNEHSGSNDHRRGRRRFLGGDDENDGDGEEQERFNCYDDAGYTNVNQCYKFETHTSLEAATRADLKKASAQGSILWIRSGWSVYGAGGYASPMSIATLAGVVGFVALAAAGFVGLAFCVGGHLRRKGRETALRHSGGDGTGADKCHSKGVESTDSESTCDASSSTGSGATDASNAARNGSDERGGVESGMFGAALSRTKNRLRMLGFLESRRRRAMPSSLRDTFYVENDYGAFVGEKYNANPSAANGASNTGNSIDNTRDESGEADRGTMEMGIRPFNTSHAEATGRDLPTSEYFLQQHHLLYGSPAAAANGTWNRGKDPDKTRDKPGVAENNVSGGGIIELGAIAAAASHTDIINSDLPTTEYVQQQYQVNMKCNTGVPNKSKDEPRAAENDISVREKFEMGGVDTSAVDPKLPTTEYFRQQYQLLYGPPFDKGSKKLEGPNSILSIGGSTSPDVATVEPESVAQAKLSKTLHLDKIAKISNDDDAMYASKNQERGADETTSIAVQARSALWRPASEAEAGTAADATKPEEGGGNAAAPTGVGTKSATASSVPEIESRTVADTADATTAKEGSTNVSALTSAKASAEDGTAVDATEPGDGGGYAAAPIGDQTKSATASSVPEMESGTAADTADATTAKEGSANVSAPTSAKASAEDGTAVDATEPGEGGGNAAAPIGDQTKSATASSVPEMESGTVADAADAAAVKEGGANVTAATSAHASGPAAECSVPEIESGTVPKLVSLFNEKSSPKRLRPAVDG